MLVLAPAKLNLSLHIVGKRADGYHLLESLVAFTQFGDHLELEPAESLSLSIGGPFAAGLEAEHNLVMKAAQLLQKRTHHKGGARMRLEKNIPVGAGLGGGSADAAAALKGLAALWGVPATLAELNTLALQLGADVPVCVKGTPSWMTGIGEQLNAVTLPPAWVVLVNPRTPLPTADVFRRYAGNFSAPVTKAPQAITHTGQLSQMLASMRNDLEHAAIGLVPEIGEILSEIKRQPGCALSRMSGSGATCFGLFGHEGEAVAARNALAKIHASWWSVATPL